MEEIENWKDIPDYEGMYQVSDLGRVRGLERTVNSYGGGKMDKPAKIITPKRCKLGYLRARLCKNGVDKTYAIHRLVLATFTYASELKVDHLDMVKSNNRLSNLEYVTQRENVRRGIVATRKLLGSRRKSQYLTLISVNGKSYNVGSFNTQEESNARYNEVYNNLENFQNYIFKRKNPDLPKGVIQRGKLFQANRTFKGIVYNLGKYCTAEEAGQAYQNFKI